MVPKIDERDTQTMKQWMTLTIFFFKKRINGFGGKYNKDKIPFHKTHGKSKK